MCSWNFRFGKNNIKLILSHFKKYSTFKENLNNPISLYRRLFIELKLRLLFIVFGFIRHYLRMLIYYRETCKPSHIKVEWSKWFKKQINRRLLETIAVVTNANSWIKYNKETYL